MPGHSCFASTASRDLLEKCTIPLASGQEHGQMFAGFERKRIAVDGAEIACVVGGAGPPILMLHGFPQSLAMWAGVAPLLPRDFTVVCADLRGYGDSSKPHPTPHAA